MSAPIDERIESPGGAAHDQMHPVRTVRIVFGVVALTIAIGALTILLQSAPRRSGTNMASDLGYAIGVQPGQVLCQPEEAIPAGTAAAGLRADTGTTAGPPLRISVTDGTTVASGMLPGGWRRGAVRIPFGPVPARTLAGATLCVTDAGSRPVSFGGASPDGPFLMRLNGRPVAGRVRVDYLYPGRKTWLGLAGELSHRMSLLKPSWMRPWATLATLALVLGAICLAVMTLCNGVGAE